MTHRIDYEVFDKESCEIYEEIISLLKRRPYTRKDIFKFINASVSRINEQINRLRKKGIIVKRKIRGSWYYGVRQILRSYNSNKEKGKK